MTEPDQFDLFSPAQRRERVVDWQVPAPVAKVAMGLSGMVFALLPWLDRSPVKSIRYRGAQYKTWLTIFVVSFVILGYLGTVPSNVWGTFAADMAIIGGVDRATLVARICSVLYFLFFVLMPWYSAIDRTKPVPERVTA